MRKRFTSFNRDIGSIRPRGGKEGGKRKKIKYSNRASQMEMDQQIILGNAALAQYYARLFSGSVGQSQRSQRETIMWAIEQTKIFAEQNGIKWVKE